MVVSHAQGGAPLPSVLGFEVRVLRQEEMNRGWDPSSLCSLQPCLWTSLLLNFKEWCLKQSDV